MYLRTNIEMNKFVITYGSLGYYESQKRFKNSLLQKDVKVFSYNDKWIKKTAFYSENKFILDQKRGAGYWLWKPYILLSAFEKMGEGDLVLYCDADAVVLGSFDCLFDICKRNGGIMLFDNSVHLNKTWIKRDCFILMDADKEIYYNAGQAMGGCVVLQKNENSKRFLEEWINYAKDYRISTDAENELGKKNMPEFKEHRHDQAILSILRLKWNLPLFRDPSQFGNPYKIVGYRKPGEFLIDGKYQDEAIKENSPYDTLIDLQDPAPAKQLYSRRILSKIKHLLKL